MFVRFKKKKGKFDWTHIESLKGTVCFNNIGYSCQLVENKRIDGKVKQKVIKYLGHFWEREYLSKEEGEKEMRGIFSDETVKGFHFLDPKELKDKNSYSCRQRKWFWEKLLDNHPDLEEKYIDQIKRRILPLTEEEVERFEKRKKEKLQELESLIGAFKR